MSSSSSRPGPQTIAHSPGRPSPLSRPHWPWSTYSHRSSVSSASAHSSSSSVPTSAQSQGSMADDVTTRQWNYNAFEWVIRDVSRLRDHIENPALEAAEDVEVVEDDDFEVLRESPELGDGKFKLEITKTTINEAESASNASSPSLSLYLTSLMVDYAHTDYETSATMFAAIKCQDDRAGERGARAEWAWEIWQNNWVFRQGTEVWECPLPPLSTLLENPRIQETDSFVICVQIHSPVGPFYPQQPSAYYVPRDLLDGLEASLDNASKYIRVFCCFGRLRSPTDTGDVQFICLERTTRDQLEYDSAVPASPRSTSSSQSSSSSQTLARKRILYAHSDILVRRSEYFATMLASSFNENAPAQPGGRRLYTIVVEEADFVTIYWLLKWVYANWLLFRAVDDPRLAVDGVGAGWSARDWCAPGVPDEWGWKVFHKAGHLGSGIGIGAASASDTPSGAVSDARSVTSGASGLSTGPDALGLAHAPRDAKGAKPGSGQVRAGTATAAKGPPSPSASRPPGTPTTPRRASGPAPVGLSLTPATGAAARGAKPVPVPQPLSPSAAAHYPAGPGSAHGKQRSRGSGGGAGGGGLTGAADPHAHPTRAPPPASALSMYQLAHRYGMPGLGALALEHVVATVTARSAFAVLLASAAWEELHGLVQDFVVERWEEVSVSDEFERCCQEVASGEWGPEGGKTLMALFRRLRSPSAMGYARG
ncbi:uncharacterized protein BXZ73DRAFT_87645 [Epithele typhae]|uniref:uncharacterized protein n=1 Tax=Epithele typhae TaxID=378194 RepID=UPI0020089657|nr:uncharacterized protein BXZ73DRAFT_87645 [Epithele typhae]KAH9943286.1 hypothetical protein BXZ73DRAFT_87645 [Epithele typhae]